MKLILAATILTFSAAASAWDGQERNSGDYIEISRGQLVREGEDIEYYNQDTAESHEAEVVSIDEGGQSTNVVVTDNDSGETSILEME